MPKKKLLIIFNKYKEFGGEEASFISDKLFYEKKYHLETLEFSNRNTLNLFISFFNPISFLKTFVKLLKFKPDIIYFNNLWFSASNSAILASYFFKNSQKIIKLHNFRLSCAKADHYLKKNTCNLCNLTNKNASYINKCYKNSIFSTFLINIYSLIQSNIIRSKLIDKVLILNDLQKTYLVDFGIKEKKIYLVKNNINFKFSTNKKLNSLEKNVFHYIGRLEEEKGVLDLIKVWTSINNKKYQLKIIGTGSLDEKVKGLIQNSNNISSIGYLDSQSIQKELQISKGLIFPSRLHEGQPTVILEAMKFLVPVISPRNAFFETFGNGFNLSTYTLCDIYSFESLLLEYFDEKFYIKEKMKWEKFSNHFFSNYENVI